jgi:hypothetical protein
LEDEPFGKNLQKGARSSGSSEGPRDVKILDFSLAPEAAREMASDVAGWRLIDLGEKGDTLRKGQLRMVATREVSCHARVGWACLRITLSKPGHRRDIVDGRDADQEISFSATHDSVM